MSEQFEQGTLEWRMDRVGFATASRIADIVKTNQNGKHSAKRAKYFDELVAERLTGQPQDWKEVASLEARKALEPEARAAYTFDTGAEVAETGFIKHPTIEWAGASPDGLVKRSGMVEIKCFDAANHFKLFDERADSVIGEHLPQVYFGMACTGRTWCDFVAFNPTAPPMLKLFIKRFERDEAKIALLETAVKEFLAEVGERVLKLSG